MRPPRPEPRSGLPAPYESPWRRLVADLWAVLASLRLGLQELWRRNAEGDLPRPGLWPAALAPAFWPLLLAILLALGLAGGVLLVRQLPAVPPVAPQLGAASPDAREPAGRSPDAERPSTGPSDQESAEAESLPVVSGVGDRAGTPAAAPEAEPVSPGLRPAGSGAAEGLQRSDGSAPDTSSEQESAPESAPAAASLPEASGALPEPERLLRSLVGEPLPQWVQGLQTLPAQSLLRLRLGEGFESLSEPERRRFADTWLERAQQLGYERLELIAPPDRLLARSARVGSGMILLESSSARR